VRARSFPPIALACLVAAGTAFSIHPSPAHRAALAEYLPHQLLIKYRPLSTPGSSRTLAATEEPSGAESLTLARQQLTERLSLRHLRQLGQSEWQIAEFSAEVSLDEAVALARANPAVESAEPNYVLRLFSAASTRSRAPLVSSPNDPEFGKQWALQHTGQYGGTPGSDLGALAAWQMARSHQTVVVAVIDTGVDYAHPDLANRMWTNSREIPGNGVDDDGNGYVDDVRGWNFASRHNDPLDDHYHGTHLAGVIAAEINNGFGVAGVTGTVEVRIMPLKFFNASAQATTAAAVEAIDYATRNGARIINASWGDMVYSQALYEAVRRSVNAGCLLVAAAGNSGGDNDRVPVYPASFNSGPNALSAVISVAGTDEADRMLSSSNYGAKSVDLAAPSNFIYSAMPRGTFGFLSGTSSAAALVSGTAALVWAHNPALTNAQIKEIVRGSARRVPAAQGKTLSGGIAHAHQALLATPPYQVTGTVTSVSAADYVTTVAAPDSIVAAFGAKLATGTEIAVSLPLPVILAGSTVRVNGVTARLFAATPNQINFLLPPGLPPGPAEIVVTAGDGFVSTGTIPIVSAQPSIFTANQAGSGAPAAVWTLDGVSYFLAGRADGVPLPLEAGSYLVLACTGLRHAPNPDGNNSNGVAESVQVTIGGVPAPVPYAGAQSDFAGLDQVNIQVPASLRGRGQVELVMTVASKTANKVVISVR
jgi:uncharacterized protein (TIGR03437 family)